ncbi:hypothetical protein [Oceanobacillus jeddahense]|uniref:Uncharacterized protein n=1 Tax=Oceanobacillus jeddahense TaxID=1462527 RepID=A0ABY5JQV9_9BACI|nr:hypothetical protein [Oceanobacillus jeddahense]UUI02676.1 hypothetical protein NP439_22000 [Oceanobacillus jeddahense]
MKNFFHLYHQTSTQLGRELEKSEVTFLKWMYERYTVEEISRRKLSEKRILR